MTNNYFELNYFQQIFKEQERFLENGSIQDSFQNVLGLVKKASDSSFAGSILFDADVKEERLSYFSNGNDHSITLWRGIIENLSPENEVEGLVLDKVIHDQDSTSKESDYGFISIEVKKGLQLILVLIEPKCTDFEKLEYYITIALNCLKLILLSIDDLKTLPNGHSDKKYSFEDFLGGSTDIICVYDKNFKPIYSSSSFKEKLGFCPDASNKKLFLNKFFNGQKNNIYSTIDQNKRGRFEFESISGEKLWFDTVLSPIKSEKGEVEAFLAVSRDVSNEEKLKSNQKFELQKEKELNSLKSQFISITSHEFKTPLSTIKSSVEICKIELERNLDTIPSREKFTKHFKRINSEADRMNTLLNNLLNLEKINQGGIHIKRKKKYVNNYLVSVLENYLDQELVFLDTDLPEDFQIVIDGDLVRQSLLNLVDNALKYGSRDLKPVVKTYLKDDELNLCVQDFGEGISDEDKKNLFKPFYRASNSHKYEKGSGLGLKITREFVELQGGKVSFESELGKGSTFIIHLPLSEKD
ncbi:PAS domain-containing sensor histidine kinase [Echinicola marina]|uniref:PAS domain-containing sensor histidine kinase n=1 Tax=Echinicola marina TaxID=2859768 RepID=UPI001CF70C20|nr:PAS domain-containing sensor histidine kinase [Echinicola marina]UCS95463.1 PAS domain-containing sensor histidine kinase [Echinicola marina]